MTKPMSVTQYLDYAYPLNNRMVFKDEPNTPVKVKIHHIGEFAVTFERPDGTRRKINVNPGCDVYPPDNYDRNRLSF